MPSATPRPPAARPSLRREVWLALAVVALGVLLRAPRMRQSLWLDEMTTLADYVLQPWSKVLAAGAGQYVPNNHVLHTALAKGVYTALTGGRAAAERGASPVEMALRLPAVAAAALLPIALAWPLRRRAPLAALAVAVVTALNPWLVDLGAEARGYTLMLLFGVVATHLLPTVDSRARRSVAYAVALAAAAYTIPLAVLLVPAHAVAVWTSRPPARRRHALAAAGGMLLTAALYLPMVHGLVAYYRHPYHGEPYRTFVDDLPREVLTGQRTPRHVIDPRLPAGHDHAPDAPGSAVFWALPVLVTLVGTALSWSRFPDARPLLATLATVTAIGIALPLVVPAMAEARFVVWAAPWFCLAAALLIAAVADLRTAAGSRAPGRALAAATAAVLVGLMGWWAATLPPDQQVREAVALADRLAPPGRLIVIAYVGDLETIALYGNEAPHHPLLPAYDAPALVDAVARAGQPPWVVIFFERLARDEGRTDPAIAGLWQDISTHYRLVARLDGLVSPAAIYAPLGNATTLPAVADGG